MMAVAMIGIAVIPWGGILQRAKAINVQPAAGQTPLQAAARSLPSGAELVPDATTVDAPGGKIRAQVTYRYAFQIARLNIGVLFIIAVLSLAVYGVVLGGWASNNKYSFLGGLRATAQMISYEIPLGLSLLSIAVMFGTLELGQIVEKQAHCWLGFLPAWNLFTQPLAFVMFLVCIHAEANRAPFDLPEAEQELVGGYHTEYSSMRFALFFLAEYAGMITTSAVCVALFLGGWHFPGLGGSVDPANPAVTTSSLIILLRCAVYFAKVVLVIFIFMWVRWSLPRFRFDQLMKLAWRGMIPIALAILLTTVLLVYSVGWSNEAFRDYRRLGGKMALALLAANAAILAGTVLVGRLLPPDPQTNRRLRVADSRFSTTPLPAGATTLPHDRRISRDPMP
jgi:NADH-quinone oxidoreductase subunit H